MTLRFPAIAAAVLCCISCIDKNNLLGGDLTPTNQTYSVYTADLPIEEMDLQMADSLSGYSSRRITVGAVRDDQFGLTTRACALTLIPMFIDSLDLGKDPVFGSFHFAVARDTVSVDKPSQENIIQSINVYEMSKPINSGKDYGSNSTLEHFDKRITKGRPLYNGGDSLSFNFTEDFGRKFLTITKDDLSDIDKYTKKFPGIYISADEPIGTGGRIDMFNLQLDYNSSYSSIVGNLATLRYSAEFDGERKDTTLLFYLGATDFYDIDSLLNYSSTGQFPEYCLNLTGHDTRKMAGKVTDKAYVEGGGGLKPVISAKAIKRMAEEAIAAKGGDPKTAVINKASLVFPFEFPSDYTDMEGWPDILSPTCRIKSDTLFTFMNLTDASSSSENQGDVNRLPPQYAPDITYHLQELLKIDESDKDKRQTQFLEKGYYDIWLLIMAKETTTVSSSSSSETSEYYQNLAYQSYYSSMYGGYSSGYSDYYSNYYTYMMMAQYASGSSTTSTSTELDRDRFYRACLNGPGSSGRVPTLKLTFSIPK